MKLHKLISRTVVGAALLGTTIVVAFAGINVSSDADTKNINQNAFKGNNPNPGSNGTIQVQSNGLSLDSVPNFNFQNLNNDNNNKLELQQSGQLKVSDYRGKDNPSTNANPDGWSLKVTANPIGTDKDNNDDWNLALSKTTLDGDVSSKAIPSMTQIDNPLNLKTNDTNGNSQTLISKGKYGLTKMTYSGTDATLTVPNVAPDSYTTNINWTLYTSFNGENDN